MMWIVKINRNMFSGIAETLGRAENKLNNYFVYGFILVFYIICVSRTTCKFV